MITQHFRLEIISKIPSKELTTKEEIRKTESIYFSITAIDAKGMKDQVENFRDEIEKQSQKKYGDNFKRTILRSVSN